MQQPAHALAPVPAHAGNGAPQPVLYEVEATVEHGLVGEYDEWLPGHVERVLASPGFLAAEILKPIELAQDGFSRRVVRYRVRDRGALEDYLEERAPRLRAEVVERFGDRIRFERRILGAAATFAAPGTVARCANCDAPLAGPYCARCGQLARESARSLHTLFHDFWHSLTHTDGRFWQTIRSLVLRPGFLTAEYFAERRARYIPPFRLYLVVSLAFFVLLGLSGALEADGSAADEATAELGREVSGAIAGAARDPANPERQAAVREAAGRLEAAAERAAAARRGAAVEGGFRPVRVDGGADCESLAIDGSPRLTEWVRSTCRRAAADHGASLGRAFVANIPRMMFVFLPLMAAVMLLLYRRPRRYYVEHLVFFLHVHAAMFLLFAAMLGFSWLGGRVPRLDALAGVAVLALWAYAAWYVYRALRTCYGEGRGRTLGKLAVLGFVYFAFLGFTLVGNLAVSALTA